MKLRICDGHILKKLAEAGLAWLEHNQQRINQLNVFPVPDGDTGTNMYLTMRKAYEAIEGLDERHVGKVSKALADGALMGARGNSGVILSQLWRGFAEALEGCVAFDAAMAAHALKIAVDRAYGAVVTPVEGTILTVARQATEAVVERVAAGEDDLVALLEVMVNAAYTSLEHTPDLLPVLKKAGVVDSGGQGLTFMLEGMLRLLQGKDLGEALGAEATRQTWQDALAPEDEEGYGYDVQFLMRGSQLDVDKVRAAIDGMGWSTLVVGDDSLIKVHVHVHDPGQPLSYAIAQGVALDDVVVENMQRQYETYVQERLATNEAKIPIDQVAVVAVASGEWLKRLFAQDLQAADVIAGGQTMNPSTEDFMAAIEALPNKEIILLPNNKNIIMAARQAASLASAKRVRVVASESVPQGISAMFAYANVMDVRDADAVAAAMNEALGDVVTCEVTRAIRDVALEAVTARKGQYIGLLNDAMVAAGEDIVGVVRDLLHKAKADERELITLYYGDKVDAVQAEALRDQLSSEFKKQQIDLVQGGQPLYPYIISVE